MCLPFLYYDHLCELVFPLRLAWLVRMGPKAFMVPGFVDYSTTSHFLCSLICIEQQSLQSNYCLIPTLQFWMAHYKEQWMFWGMGSINISGEWINSFAPNGPPCAQYTYWGDTYHSAPLLWTSYIKDRGRKIYRLGPSWEIRRKWQHSLSMVHSLSALLYLL